MKLKKINVSGGPAQTICSLPSPAVGGAWNSDGVIIFGNGGQVVRVPSVGGSPTPITKLDPLPKEVRHLLPVFLPDGHHFLYLRISGIPENSGIYMGSLDTRPEEQSSKLLIGTTFGPVYVPTPHADIGQLLFLRERVLMAQQFEEHSMQLIGEPAVVADTVGSSINGGFFSASPNGVLLYRTGATAYRDFQLTWPDVKGSRAGKVWEPGPYTYLAVAPDGSHAAVARRSYETAAQDIWLADFARATGTRSTFETDAQDLDPVWSPDGERIAFRSNREGTYDLYLKPANNGKDAEPLLKSAQPKTPSSWSHDGHSLLFTAFDPKTKDDIWVLPVTSGKANDQKPLRFLATEFDERDGHFSPDSRWVAYVSNESGRDEVYVREFSSTSDSGKWLISNGGGANPRWRSDGKAMFYSAPDSSLMVADMVVGATFEPRSPRLLFKLPPGSGAWDATADGKRFLVTIPSEENAPAPFTASSSGRRGEEMKPGRQTRSGHQILRRGSEPNRRGPHRKLPMTPVIVSPSLSVTRNKDGCQVCYQTAHQVG